MLLFLHIGGDYVIRAEEIIAIIDIKDQLPSPQSERLIIIDENDYKAYVITDSNYYLSPISSATLKKRMIISLS